MPDLVLPGLALALLAPDATVRASAQDLQRDHPDLAQLIARLDLEPLDAPALDELIDRGAAAVPALLEVVDRWESPSFARALRALRAMDEDAAAAVLPLYEVLIDDPRGQPIPSRLERAGELLDTINHLVMCSTVEANQLFDRISRLDELRLVPFNSRTKLRLLARLELIGSVTREFELRELLDHSEPMRWEFAAIRIGQSPESESWLELLETELQYAALGRTEIPATLERPAWAGGRIEDVASWRKPELIHAAIADAIARIAPDRGSAVDGLRRQVTGADQPRDRIEAVIALARLGPVAGASRPELLAALDDGDDRLVAEAITALGVVCPHNVEVAERLTRLVAERDGALRARARAVLTSQERRR